MAGTEAYLEVNKINDNGFYNLRLSHFERATAVWWLGTCFGYLSYLLIPYEFEKVFKGHFLGSKTKIIVVFILLDNFMGWMG